MCLLINIDKILDIFIVSNGDCFVYKEIVFSHIVLEKNTGNKNACYRCIVLL